MTGTHSHRDQSFSNRPTDPVATTGHGEIDERQDPPRLLTARAWVNARRARDQVFGEKLFFDPAWDILLDLYINQCRGRLSCVTDLFQAGPSPATTVLRWIAILTNRDLVSRRSDPADGRRQLITLTSAGIDAMELALDLAIKGDRSLGLERLELVDKALI